jgi:predicted nucleic acid-binding protein
MTTIIVAAAFFCVAAALVSDALARRALNRRLDRVEEAWSATLGGISLMKRERAVADAEVSERLSLVQRREGEVERALLAAVDRLASIDKSVALVPAGLTALGEQFRAAFEEMQENTLPEDSKDIGATAIARIQNVRAMIAEREAQSLRALNESVEQGKSLPKIRVGVGS